MIHAFRFLTLLLLLFNPEYGPVAFGQAQEYVTENAVPVRSIHIQDTDYTDLSPLAGAIGDKRIVMLGELYHGDATAFQAKARLIRFLHEKMGFNVLAYEADFFALNHGWDAYKAGSISIDSLIYLSIYPIWTQCKEWQPVQQYARDCAKGHELKLTGFDNRGYSGYGLKHLAAALRSFLDSSQIPFTKSTGYGEYLKILRAAPRLAGGGDRKRMDSLVHYTGIILKQLPGSAKHTFYGKLIESQLAFYKMAIYYKYDSIYARSGKDYPLHDLQMAENLQWLAGTKYANEKIIVWAHNMHIEKGKGDSTHHNQYNSMGYYFTQDPALAAQTYILGFTCYTGSGKLQVSRPAEKVTKPPKKSIENWLHQRGYPFSFLDLSRMENEKPFSMKTYINTASEAPWNKYYDGIFFIAEMAPCTGTGQ